METHETAELPQILGEDGEPCGECGAPLAADQRYCLNCGQRHGEPRVAFRAAAGASTAAASPPEVTAVQAAQAPPGRRDYSPLAAVAGIAILGLMLLVGVLLGREDAPETAAAPAPIVQVGESAGAETEESSADGAADRKGGQKAKDSDEFAGKRSKRAGGGGSEAEPVEASKEQLEALQNADGEDYAEASEELPDTIATPGEPPPVDNVAPGGGSGGGVTIK